MLLWRAEPRSFSSGLSLILQPGLRPVFDGGELSSRRTRRLLKGMITSDDHAVVRSLRSWQLVRLPPLYTLPATIRVMHVMIDYQRGVVWAVGWVVMGEDRNKLINDTICLIVELVTFYLSHAVGACLEHTSEVYSVIHECFRFLINIISYWLISILSCNLKFKNASLFFKDSWQLPLSPFLLANCYWYRVVVMLLCV